jgi:hypothetical protein
MSSAAIGATTAQLASVLAAGAMQKDHLGLAAAQINAAAAAAGDSAPVPSSSAQAPGTFEAYA